MQPFPNLTRKQVTLIRVEKITGYIVDEDFDFVLSDTQKIYTVFDSFEKAKKKADEITWFNTKVEVAIYSSKRTLLYRSSR